MHGKRGQLGHPAMATEKSRCDRIDQWPLFLLILFLLFFSKSIEPFLSASIISFTFYMFKFYWCMRCDGLPDPGHLPQLNAYRYRWIENSQNTEPCMERLLSRAPEFNQVLHDLNDLLENTHDIPMNQVQQLCQVKQRRQNNLNDC